MKEKKEKAESIDPLFERYKKDLTFAPQVKDTKDKYVIYI